MMIYPQNAIKLLFPNDHIAVIAFMQRLHKHKGPLFVYKKNSIQPGQISRYLGTVGGVKGHKQLETASDEYIVKECLDFTPLGIGFGLSECTNTALIRYHPYLGLLNQCKFYFNNDWPLREVPINISTAANTIAICEWLRAYMKYPPLAAQVRAFEQSTLKQAKEVKAYFRGFFREDTLFYWHTFVIKFPYTQNTEKALDDKLLEITMFRTKLLSHLKNHALITEKHTRYVWKVITVENQLALSFKILKKVSKEENNTSSQNADHEIFKAQMDKAAKTLDMDAQLFLHFTNHSCDSKPERRKEFNRELACYLNQDFWFAYYQIACKNPKKMLFGKGNDKDEK